MKEIFAFTLLVIFHISGYASAGKILAEKPYDEWNRADVIDYFEKNNIIFEGEYKDHNGGQYILVGRLDSRSEEVNLNFFLREGKLIKASLTTSQNGTFLSLNETVEDEGFQKISDSNDQLGNHYSIYQAGVVELILINRKADWPEMYFQP